MIPIKPGFVQYRLKLKKQGLFTAFSKFYFMLLQEDLNPALPDDSTHHITSHFQCLFIAG